MDLIGPPKRSSIPSRLHVSSGLAALWISRIRRRRSCGSRRTRSRAGTTNIMKNILGERVLGVARGGPAPTRLSPWRPSAEKLTNSSHPSSGRLHQRRTSGPDPKILKFRRVDADWERDGSDSRAAAAGCRRRGCSSPRLSPPSVGARGRVRPGDDPPPRPPRLAGPQFPRPASTTTVPSTGPTTTTTIPPPPDAGVPRCRPMPGCSSCRRCRRPRADLKAAPGRARSGAVLRSRTARKNDARPSRRAQKKLEGRRPQDAGGRLEETRTRFAPGSRPRAYMRGRRHAADERDRGDT